LDIGWEAMVWKDGEKKLEELRVMKRGALWRYLLSATQKQ
jgi:hypothetical protein